MMKICKRYYKLEEFGLDENRSKRNERKECVNFLGVMISMNKIPPTYERSQGIVNFNEPKSKKDLQRFLGMINYDRNFLKNITENLKPLYTLLKKDEKFLWDEERKKSFNEVKEKWRQRLE